MSSRGPYRSIRSASLASIMLLGTTAVTVSAGPNAGGTLMIHASPGLEYTDSYGDYCGLSGLSACEGANVSVTGTSPIVFHVVAAFGGSSSPRLAGVTFGVDYEQEEIVVLDRGHCGGLEIADGDWPGPGSGTGVTWSEAMTSNLTDVYWFAAYAPNGGPTIFELVPHPAQGAYFADDSVPAVLDAVAAFGSLGFGTSGSVACPSSGQENGPLDGDGCEFPDGPEGDDSVDPGVIKVIAP